MNTSARRGPAAPLAKNLVQPQPFPYNAVAGGRASAANRLPGFASSGMASDGAEAARRESQARDEGRQQGQSQARQAFEEQLVKERSGLAAALEGFQQERAAYFEKVESEVVQLALAIARKVLHREAQVDPWLLTGITRVALDQIDGATRVTLRLHPQNAHSWRAFLATRLEPAAMPEIVEDSGQPPDRCTLETAMGTAEIGLEVQLKEIEQGLADLLAVRREKSGE